MSRRISNPKLARLCQAHEWSVSNLACALKCTRQNIRLYASGRKPMPLLERKLAAVFKLSVPDFRKIIFSKRRSHASASAACLKTVRIRQRVLWRWDRASGREQWLNGGDLLANDANFMQYRAEGMRQPRGAVIKGHRIGGAVKFQLFTVTRSGKRRSNNE